MWQQHGPHPGRFALVRVSGHRSAAGEQWPGTDLRIMGQSRPPSYSEGTPHTSPMVFRHAAAKREAAVMTRPLRHGRTGTRVRTRARAGTNHDRATLWACVLSMCFGTAAIGTWMGAMHLRAGVPAAWWVRLQAHPPRGR